MTECEQCKNPMLKGVHTCGRDPLWRGPFADLKVSQWQPIETEPKNGTEFLAYSDASEEFGVAFWAAIPGKKWLVCRNSIGEDFNPTHWQPLPEPPK